MSKFNLLTNKFTNFVNLFVTTQQIDLKINLVGITPENQIFLKNMKTSSIYSVYKYNFEIPFKPSFPL